MPIHDADIAAHTLQELGKDVRTMLVQREDLTELPGIGDGIAGKIREIVETGRCARSLCTGYTEGCAGGQHWHQVPARLSLFASDRPPQLRLPA